MYLDFHAHSGKKGSFMYGNALDYKNMVETHLFMKLIALNSRDFDWEGCDFSAKNMVIADASDGLSKEGSGRVQAYKKYNIFHSYTLECNYTNNRFRNPSYIKSIYSKFRYTLEDFAQWYWRKNV